MNEVRLETEGLVLRTYRLSDRGPLQAVRGSEVMRYCWPETVVAIRSMAPHGRISSAIGSYSATDTSRRRRRRRGGSWEGSASRIQKDGRDRGAGLDARAGVPGEGIRDGGRQVSLDYAFKKMKRDQDQRDIHDNKPSIKVAERLGEKLGRRGGSRRHAHAIYGVDNPSR